MFDAVALVYTHIRVVGVILNKLYKYVCHPRKFGLTTNHELTIALFSIKSPCRTIKTLIYFPLIAVNKSLMY